MSSAKTWNIDTYLDHYIPRSRLNLLPRPLSHFLGYRAPSAPKHQHHILIIWAWCSLGGFLGVALIEGVYLHLPALNNTQVPTIIASFGAAAILEYNTIESPLAQPRNLVIGHFLSAVTGICVTKLFHLLPESRFEQLRWLAGALSVGAASFVMSITRTVHPPAGATALLAATDVTITHLGWWLLPLILLGSMLMLVSALILNNVMRQFPLYWWTPVDLAALRRNNPKAAGDLEKADATDSRLHRDILDQQVPHPQAQAGPGSESATEFEDELQNSVSKQPPHQGPSADSRQSEIIIARDEISVPQWFQATEAELSMFQSIQRRMKSASTSVAVKHIEDVRHALTSS